MAKLQRELQRLFDWLRDIDLAPPVDEIRIVEMTPEMWRSSDSLGRIVVPAAAIQDPSDYEARFHELMHSGLDWINLSCYGVHNGSLIVAVEVPKVSRGDDGAGPTAVNLSGPMRRVVDNGWDASAIMVEE